MLFSIPLIYFSFCVSSYFYPPLPHPLLFSFSLSASSSFKTLLPTLPSQTPLPHLTWLDKEIRQEVSIISLLLFIYFSHVHGQAKYWGRPRKPSLSIDRRNDLRGSLHSLPPRVCWRWSHSVRTLPRGKSVPRLASSPFTRLYTWGPWGMRELVSAWGSWWGLRRGRVQPRNRFRLRVRSWLEWDHFQLCVLLLISYSWFRFC